MFSPCLRYAVVRRVLLLVFAVTATSAAERPDAIDDVVAEFFRPFEHDLATLSPDGRHVAMTDQGRGKSAAIMIVDVDAQTARNYFVARDPEHAVLQLQWISASRLAFTTRSRGVGTLEITTGEIKAQLLSRDLDLFLSKPNVGPRSNNISITPDMAAGEVASGASPFDRVRHITARDAMAQARLTGDLFSLEAKRDGGRALRPFLRGAKPGAPNTLLVELRGDGDLFVYPNADYARVIVPANVFIADLPGPPSDLERGDWDNSPANQYAAYGVEFPPPPLVVLELDTNTGRSREIAVEEHWRRVWLDHQGRVRLALEQKSKRFRYLYRAADSEKWVPLDQLAKRAGPLAFNVGADNLLSARSVPLGFDATGNSLFIASSVGRDTFTLRALDLTKGQLEEFELGHTRYDLIEPTALTAADVLRFDPRTHALAGIRFAAARRSTHWLDPSLKALQVALDQKVAPQRCDIREWNADLSRILVDLTGVDDPGGFSVFDRATGTLLHCGDRAPWMVASKRNTTHEFDFVVSDGRRVAGFLTLPRQPRLNPPPVLVYFHDGPWFSEPPVFNRGAQALASLGFAVLQLNYRGSSGLGRTHLEAHAGGLDRTALQDVQAVLAQAAAEKMAINPKMVAALGNGIGGYLAVRMAQLAPETFRCAVAINAPGDLEAWRKYPETASTMLGDLRGPFFGADHAALRAQSAVAAGPTTKAPVLIVHGTHNAYVPEPLGRELYHALKKGSPETAFVEMPDESHGGWSDETTAKLFAELGRFFNATIYKYSVDFQKPRVVP